MKMLISGILISLVLLLGVNGDYDYKDYQNEDLDDYSEECFGSDKCALYSSMNENCACHHQQFPSETLEQRYGENIKKCCNFHGYRFHNNDCEV